MKKILALLLSLLLIAAFAFTAGCKKAEEPAKAPAPTPSPAPEQKPAEVPAPAPVPEKKPAETPAPVPEKKATEAPAPAKKKPAETAVTKQKAAESPVAKLKPAEKPSPLLTKLNLADYKGKVVMLEFTASWCPPCRTSAKDIQTIYEKYKGKGFVVLGIFVDNQANAASEVDSFVKKLNITYPVFIDDGSVNKQYGVNAIHTKFIINKQGKIIKTHTGGKFDIEALSKEIEGLL